MRESRSWRRFVRLPGPNVAADVREELGFHLESRTADFIAQGMSPDEARAEALRRFGDLAHIHAECEGLERGRMRRMSRLQRLVDVRQDLAFATRTLLRQPGFTAAAVLTLALGIGLTTAVFSAVNSLMFRPLPVREPDRLVVVASTERGQEVPGNVTYQNYLDIDARHDVFEGAAGFDLNQVSVRLQGDGERKMVVPASANYFSIMGVQARAGRVFTEEDARERSPVVVLADSYWRDVLARDPSVIGRSIRINGVPFTVIGVLPPDFHGGQPIVDPDLYVPITLYPQLDPGTQRMFERRDCCSVRVIARLKPGVTIEQARASLATLATDLNARYPEANSDLRFVAELERRARPDIAVARLTPWIAMVFMSLVTMALLVACANVTNLLLVRAAARSAEMAVRRSLGAGSERLIRQLLTESMLLSLAALVCGLGIARWCVAWLNGLKLAIDGPLHFGVEIDWRVFLFAAAVAIASGLLAGLAPAIRGSRVPLTDALREGGRGGSAGRARGRLRNAIIVGQVAISFVLLVCAALFSRSVATAARTTYGFRSDSVFMMSMDVSLQRYSEQRGRAFYDQLLTRTRSVPGVQSAALSMLVPLGGNSYSTDVTIDEPNATLKDGKTTSLYNALTEDYIRTTGHHLLQGREFTARDDSTAPPVALVNEALAQRLWPGEPVLGRRLRVSKDAPYVEVVGLVKNTPFLFLNETPQPIVYLSARQRYRSGQTLSVHSTIPPAVLAQTLRSIVRDMDPELVTYDMRTIETHLHDGFALFFVRVAANLAMAIGVLGLLQTVVGLFGVLSYVVTLRTREIGVRMALGAQQRDVIRGILRQGGVLVLGGLALGIAMALGITRTLSALLIGVTPTDGIAYGASALLLIMLALISCYLPARRAARLEPVLALRRDG